MRKNSLWRLQDIERDKKLAVKTRFDFTSFNISVFCLVFNVIALNVLMLTDLNEEGLEVAKVLEHAEGAGVQLGLALLHLLLRQTHRVWLLQMFCSLLLLPFGSAWDPIRDKKCHECAP